jgi:hypothetical protein
VPSSSDELLDEDEDDENTDDRSLDDDDDAVLTASSRSLSELTVSALTLETTDVVSGLFSSSVALAAGALFFDGVDVRGFAGAGALALGLDGRRGALGFAGVVVVLAPLSDASGLRGAGSFLDGRRGGGVGLLGVGCAGGVGVGFARTTGSASALASVDSTTLSFFGGGSIARSIARAIARSISSSLKYTQEY